MESNVLSSVLEVFNAVGTWISDSVSNLTPMFYTAESGLTFLGVLSVSGLAFSVTFLILRIIGDYLHFQR